jgi:hypothetical protein
MLKRAHVYGLYFESTTIIVQRAKHTAYKTYGGRIVPEVKKLPNNKYILQGKTLPPIQVCFVKLF